MNDLPEPPTKKLKKTPEVSLNDLPVLPFEKILSYLSLEDLIRSRVVSRWWCKQTNGFRVKTLCLSSLPSGSIKGKARLMSGVFAQNFIQCSMLKPFSTFTTTILANLNHLRLCDLNLNSNYDRKLEAKFLETMNSFVNSFGQLTRLDLIWINESFSWGNLDLNLPMLSVLNLEGYCGIKKLTLDAPRLQQAKISYLLGLNIIHSESVERLAFWSIREFELKKLKNLKQLYIGDRNEFDLTFLDSLKQLNEIHLFNRKHVPRVFERKQQYDRSKLKVYLLGLLLNGPDDPAIETVSAKRGSYLSEEAFACLAQNTSRLADEVPFGDRIPYAVEGVVPELAIDVANRFTNLEKMIVSEPVEDIDRFLDFLKNINVAEVWFNCEQPQELFDRLPEYPALQKLIIHNRDLDIDFLFQLENLISIDLNSSISFRLIRDFFEELEFLSRLFFFYNKRGVSIVTFMDKHCKKYEVSLISRKGRPEEEILDDLGQAIWFVKDSLMPSRYSEDSGDSHYIVNIKSML